MRALAVFRKSLREQLRNLKLLSLSLTMAPLCVALYWLFFPSGSTSYGVLVLNADVAVELAGGHTLAAGEQVIEALRRVTYQDGKPLLKVAIVDDLIRAESQLKDRDAAALLVLPADLSRVLQAAIQGGDPVTTSATFVGDLSNPQYSVAAVMASTALESVVQTLTGQARPVEVSERTLGASGARTEFENYVPGLLILAVVMLIFQSAMTVAHEIESGALRRLQLTRMTSLDLLAGVSATQVLLAVGAVVLTFLTAAALGFRSQGPLWVAVVVGAVTSLSTIGVGLLVACFSRTTTEAFLVGNLPLVVLMFFSGAMYPMPRVPLFAVGGHTIGLYDALPPTHAVVALNKVLTLGAGLGDVVYELSAVLLLSILYFAIGVLLFQRIHLKAE